MSFRTLFFILLLSVLFANIHAHERHRHAYSARHYALSARAVFGGFLIVELGSLEGLGLGETCERILYQPLKCDNYTASFSTLRYRRSLGDKDLSALVCDNSCSGALRIFSRQVNSACTAKKEIYAGYPVAALIDTIWGGWNETCLMDTSKSRYCNACNLPSSTPTKPNDGFNMPAPSAPSCASQSYETVNGDTCDSITKSKLVLSTSLYALNPMLFDCLNIPAGTKVCLLLLCEKLYEVQKSDSCPDVADIVLWNELIDLYCSNLDQTDPNFGKTICISLLGGTFTNPPANGTGGNTGGHGGSGDGYSDNQATLPSGATLVPEYYTTKAGDTCEAILRDFNTPGDLFIAVNPSLRNMQGCL
ncbi:hypothetical protein GQ44DRAFT_743219 [Phaeosphaeriaceae sp. PMI808]|nr:hypothetical protein GQ44DRAFT_743219 [Phaeosphaeriaceae sp. PMI808]